MKGQGKEILLAGIGFLIVLFAAYYNHFDNGFYFDDGHTIVDNEYIRDMGNWKMFWTDSRTSSTLVSNRDYRPMVTFMNALDYKIGGKDRPDPFYYHVSIFFWFVVQSILLFFVFRTIIRQTTNHRWRDWFALLITAFYTLHTANAETINYIISRSDSFSTLCVIASLLLYQNPKTRRLHLYLLTLLIGLWTKHTALMFLPILFVYIILFEEKTTFWKVATFQNKKAIKNLAIRIAPVAVLGVGMFLFNIIELTPDSLLFKKKATSPIAYFLTQQFVITRYIGNFFLPINLSPDTTFAAVFTNYMDQRILFGLLLNASLFISALAMASKPKWRPISFGILWFYFALAPTSSFHPLGQISNDHRIFFPYVGMALAVGWLGVLLFMRYEAKLLAARWRLGTVIAAVLLVIFGHAYGVSQRNQVWGSTETLWLDAVTKGPDNGRALMNYGLTQMSKGKYEEAAEYFDRAEKLLPHWAYIHINQGILKYAQGDKEAAEEHHKKAIRFQGFNPEGYYYYARYLQKEGRPDEALEQLRIGLKKSPGHTRSKELIQIIEARQSGNIEQIIKNPTSANYLNQSLAFYKTREFEKSIQMAEKALELDPQSAEAYNNICAAHCGLKQWEKAIEACNKALEIKPEFQRAKNNLRWAVGELEKK